MTFTQSMRDCRPAYRRMPEYTAQPARRPELCAAPAPGSAGSRYTRCSPRRWHWPWQDVPPVRRPPYINLAIAQHNTGKLDAAEENLKKALAIDPDHPVANNEYAIVQRRTGRFAEARKTYERILAKPPAFIPARKNLAILCDLYMKDFA